MSVFRLQDEQAANLQDGRGWFQSAPYNPQSIAAITDPDGGKGSDPTSIPTPFARMDLVRTAFKFVNDKGIDEDTSFHQIVSHALDIGEMFFNYELFEDKLSLLEWDKTQQIETLLNSNSHEQHNYGKTLQMYMKQVEDAKSFNFNSMQKVYILLFNNIPIGGTSPISLFFSTPNELNHVNVRFRDGKKAFRDIRPLYLRDKAFIKFLFCMKESMANFPAYFPEIDDYLDKNRRKIQSNNMALFDEINALDENQYPQYKSFSGGIYILNDLPLRQSNGDTDIVGSDYAIESEIYKGDIAPLVIKRGHSGKADDGSQMMYYNGPFDQQIDVPYEEPTPLNERYLPGRTGVKYPYLTIGDFLEPYIIRTVFPVDKEKFYDGNYNRDDDISYLLPLKKTFFEFFKPKDLERIVGEGKKMFEIQHRAGNRLKVILRIPVKKGYIEYEREYKGPLDDIDDPKPNPGNNEGAITEHRFNLAVFPFVKFNESVAPEYRIALIDGDIKPPKSNHNIDLSFSKIDDGIKEVAITHSKQRAEKKERQLSGVKNYVLKDNFDLINVNINGTDKRGVLIPRFETKGTGNDNFTFAVDLGTTYTHIEYSVNNGTPQPFNITNEDIQVGKLHDPKFERIKSVMPEEKEIFDHDFVPELIDNNMEYYFPVRTSIMELKDMKNEDVCFSMVERNIPFIYEKKPENYRHCRVCSDLKWGVTQNDSERIKAFIANIILILRNKVVLNNGKLENTKIIWFYPLSMMEGRKNLLERRWNKLYEYYFTSNPDNQVVPVPESLAPFYYYHNTKGTIAHGKPVVSIDIGGETTDIVVFENNKASMLTSFRFAADSIFGDGYKINASEVNGFIKHYGKKVHDAFIQNNIEKTLISTYKQIKEKHVSKDTIAFFFSLEKNKELENKNLELSLNQWLFENDEFKIAFVIFYVAIIYHIAKILKIKNFPLPRYVTFSGTGSKVLNIITQKDKLLEQLTKVIFEKVSEREFDNEGLNIERDDEIPKEITCKGGFFANNHQEPDISKLKTVLTGTENDSLADRTLTYNKIDDNILKSVEKEILNFLDFAFKIFENEETDIKKFMVKTSKLEFYKKILSKDLYSFICEGLELQRKELESPDEPVEETLFFYGLKGSINKLINEITNPEDEEE